MIGHWRVFVKWWEGRFVERVLGFVDGFNLYFGLREAKYKGLLWLDVSRLVSNLCKPRQTCIGVKYFTARISGPGPKHDRQKTLLEAYETLANCNIHYGVYQTNSKTCSSCKAAWNQSSEKMTDVNIAVEMLSAAALDEFDTALLVSADSDLAPAVQKTIELFNKRVVIAFPPKRNSYRLRTLASAYFHISRAQLAKSQLPETITKPDGFVLERPPSWT
jgi:NYN domain-containing protein